MLVGTGALGSGSRSGGGSGGGQPPDTAPSFAALADVTVAEDAPPIIVQVTDVSAGSSEEDARGRPVTLQVSSSRPDVLAVSVAGTGRTRSITLTPQPDANGPVTVQVQASDDRGSFSRAFQVLVTPVNDPPRAEAGQVGLPQDAAVALALTGSDVEVTRWRPRSWPRRATAS